MAKQHGRKARLYKFLEECLTFFFFEIKLLNVLIIEHFFFSYVLQIFLDVNYAEKAHLLI